MTTNTGIYQDIATRTAGDIYIGVVGPVRAGKSTFIKRFMETQIIPNIDNVYRRERAKDELPQSGSGRKEQPKSKAAPSIAGSILHSACSRPIVRLSMAGLRGRGPSCVFRPLLHIQKRSLRSTGVLCPALLSAKRGGILRRREWPLCHKKRDALQRLFSFALFTRSSRGRKER